MEILVVWYLIGNVLCRPFFLVWILVLLLLLILLLFWFQRGVNTTNLIIYAVFLQLTILLKRNSFSYVIIIFLNFRAVDFFYFIIVTVMLIELILIIQLLLNFIILIVISYYNFTYFFLFLHYFFLFFSIFILVISFVHKDLCRRSSVPRIRGLVLMNVASSRNVALPPNGRTHFILKVQSTWRHFWHTHKSCIF